MARIVIVSGPVARSLCHGPASKSLVPGSRKPEGAIPAAAGMAFFAPGAFASNRECL
jgi:hypothetical protein